MAKGRFISKEICVDKKVNSLSDPWSILGFTWLITHADREGRTYGDPAVVRAMIFPRQSITVEDMEKYINDWNEKGLIRWYQADGDMYIEFPKFSLHQVGMRKDREPESTIPELVADNIRQSSGNLPAEVKLMEENTIEVNEIEEQTPVVVSSKEKEKTPLKAQAASMLTARMVNKETLKELLQVYKPDLLIDYCHAYDQAVLDKKAENPGWLIKALRQGWNIEALLKRREVTEREKLKADNPAAFYYGKFEQFVEH